jgi:hypothetical protein
VTKVDVGTVRYDQELMKAKMGNSLSSSRLFDWRCIQQKNGTWKIRKERGDKEIQQNQK